MGKTDRFTPSDGLSGGAVSCLFEDREGNIWVATVDGLDRFRDFVVSTISVKEGLSSRGVSAVLAATDGAVWLGTGYGLNRWKNGQITTYHKRGSGLPDDEVHSLFQDDRGQLWVATHRGVVLLESGRFVPISSIPEGIVYSIVADGPGSVWISHQDALFHLRRARPIVDQGIRSITPWFRAFAVGTLLALLWTAYRIRLRVVERHQAEITALNERLMKAQEQERIRIAGELHDGIMQQITGVSLLLTAAKRQATSDAEATMARVQGKLIEVGTELRQLSHNLHPPMLKDAGLPEALRGYCEEFSSVRNVPVSCDADDSVRDLSRGAALALYRIVQEALGNAVTHGGAQRVDVRLTRSDSVVALTVSDDGKGFDPTRIGVANGLGLINMRERARQLNGTFELGSQSGRGTTVHVTIPYRPVV